MPHCHTGLGEEGPRHRLALKCNTSCLPSSRICFHSRLARNSISGGATAQSPVFIQGLVSKLPPVTWSSCSYDFFKWKLFIRLPPPVHDCVKLHGLICASMIRARREICAPRRFPRRFTISRLPFPPLCVVIAVSRAVAVFRCRSRFPSIHLYVRRRQIC